MKVFETLSFMARNPIPLIVQLVCWFLYAGLNVASEDPSAEGTSMRNPRNPWPRVLSLIQTSLSDLPESLENFVIIVSVIFDDVVKEIVRDEGWIFIVLPALIIGYREAKGNLKGIAKERQTWMQWYDRQQASIKEDVKFAEPPSKSEATQVNTYFSKARRTVSVMFRNPMFFILHFTCWFSPFVLLFVVVEWAGVIETARNFAQVFFPVAIFFAIPALISCYQETRGTVKGIAKEGEVWSKWHQRQIKAIADGYPVASPPPSLNIF